MMSVEDAFRPECGIEIWFPSAMQWLELSGGEMAWICDELNSGRQVMHGHGVETAVLLMLAGF